MFLIL
jgi:hypothetical protein